MGKVMDCKVVELSELEKAFFSTSKETTRHVVEEVTVVKKPVKIRECSDLRYWRDDECDENCTRLESAG